MDRMIDRQLSRRQLLKASAAGAIAAGIGPVAVTGVQAANGRLIPPDRVGTITFTQRDVPGRVGIAASAALGVAPDDGLPRRPRLPRGSDGSRSARAPARWLARAVRVPRRRRASTRSSSPATARTPPTPAAPRPTRRPAASRRRQSRAAYLAYGHTLRGFLDEFGLEAIGNHGFIPNTWPGPSSAGGAMSDQRLRALPDRARVRVDPRHALHGHRQRPDERQRPQHRAVDDRRREVGGAQRVEPRPWGIQLYPHNHSPAYNFLQDGPMVTVTQDRVTGAPIAPTQVRGESGKRLMEYYLEITDPKLCVIELDIYWAHVAQHQHRWYYDHDGNRVEQIFDPLALVAGQTKRFALYHAKDGDRTTEAARRRQRLQHHPVRRPAQRHRLRDVLPGAGREGLAQPELRAGQRPGRRRRPRRVAPRLEVQRAQHERAPRLTRGIQPDDPARRPPGRHALAAPDPDPGGWPVHRPDRRGRWRSLACARQRSSCPWLRSSWGCSQPPRQAAPGAGEVPRLSSSPPAHSPASTNAAVKAIRDLGKANGFGVQSNGDATIVHGGEPRPLPGRRLPDRARQPPQRRPGGRLRGVLPRRRRLSSASARPSRPSPTGTS